MAQISRTAPSPWPLLRHLRRGATRSRSKPRGRNGTSAESPATAPPVRSWSSPSPRDLPRRRDIPPPGSRWSTLDLLPLFLLALLGCSSSEFDVFFF
ncbi:unnamed protein product [Linum tenue]|uniref:Uncharacterized protein n=1 Tax=Linum tenue TaxID=586396 RepID=A0AAV0JX42_9ROSI|nr:unnamed protein product [Linum tenue]